MRSESSFRLFFICIVCSSLSLCPQQENLLVSFFLNFLFISLQNSRNWMKKQLILRLNNKRTKGWNWNSFETHLDQSSQVCYTIWHIIAIFIQLAKTKTCTVVINCLIFSSLGFQLLYIYCKSLGAEFSSHANFAIKGIIVLILSVQKSPTGSVIWCKLS